MATPDRRGQVVDQYHRVVQVQVAQPVEHRSDQPLQEGLAGDVRPHVGHVRLVLGDGGDVGAVDGHRPPGHGDRAGQLHHGGQPLGVDGDHPVDRCARPLRVEVGDHRAHRGEVGRQIGHPHVVGRGEGAVASQVVGRGVQHRDRVATAVEQRRVLEPAELQVALVGHQDPGEPDQPAGGPGLGVGLEGQEVPAGPVEAEQTGQVDGDALGADHVASGRAELALQPRHRPGDRGKQVGPPDGGHGRLGAVNRGQRRGELGGGGGQLGHRYRAAPDPVAEPVTGQGQVLAPTGQRLSHLGQGADGGQVGGQHRVAQPDGCQRRIEIASGLREPGLGHGEPVGRLGQVALAGQGQGLVGRLLPGHRRATRRPQRAQRRDRRERHCHDDQHPDPPRNPGDPHRTGIILRRGRRPQRRHHHHSGQQHAGQHGRAGSEHPPSGQHPERHQQAGRAEHNRPGASPPQPGARQPVHQMVAGAADQGLPAPEPGQAGHRQVGDRQCPGQHHERPAVLGGERGRGQQGGRPEHEPDDRAGRSHHPGAQRVTADAEEHPDYADDYQRGGQHHHRAGPGRERDDEDSERDHRRPGHTAGPPCGGEGCGRRGQEQEHHGQHRVGPRRPGGREPHPGGHRSHRGQRPRAGPQPHRRPASQPGRGDEHGQYYHDRHGGQVDGHRVGPDRSRGCPDPECAPDRSPDPDEPVGMMRLSQGSANGTWRAHSCTSGTAPSGSATAEGSSDLDDR